MLDALCSHRVDLLSGCLWREVCSSELGLLLDSASGARFQNEELTVSKRRIKSAENRNRTLWENKWAVGRKGLYFYNYESVLPFPSGCSQFSLYIHPCTLAGHDLCKHNCSDNKWAWPVLASNLFSGLLCGIVAASSTFLFRTAKC